MNLIGFLVYGIYDLNNFVSCSPWIHQNIDKKNLTDRVVCFCKCNCKQLIPGFIYKRDIFIFGSQQSPWLIMADLLAF